MTARISHAAGAFVATAAYVLLLLVPYVFALLCAIEMFGCEPLEPGTDRIDPAELCHKVNTGCVAAAQMAGSEISFYGQLHDCAREVGICLADTSTASCGILCEGQYVVTSCESACRQKR